MKNSKNSAPAAKAGNAERDDVTVAAPLRDEGSSQEKRNLFLRGPPHLKDEIKRLAAKSDLTMEGYARAVLDDAVRNEYRFQSVRIPHDLLPGKLEQLV